MFDIIVTNVLVPVAIIALFIVLPLWWVLRGAARDRQQPDAQPRDLSQWISTAAIMSGLGPSWHPHLIRPRVHVAEQPIHPEEGDLT